MLSRTELGSFIFEQNGECSDILFRVYKTQHVKHDIR